MQNRTPQTKTRPSPACIGCDDCTGLCSALVELALLPEVLLHRTQLR